MKICTTCGQSKPADRQHFHYDNSTSDGYRHWCIVCVANYMKNYTPSNEKPRLTADEITEIEARTATYTFLARLTATATRAKYASMGFEVDGIKYEIKVCAKCETQKPATTDFFNRRKQNEDGLVVWCKTCIAEFREKQK